MRKTTSLWILGALWLSACDDAAAGGADSPKAEGSSTESRREGARNATPSNDGKSAWPYDNTATAAIAPEPAGPPMSEHFDRAAGEASVRPSLQTQIRGALIEHGDLGVFVTGARWSDRAQAVMNLADSLVSQGVDESALPEGLLDGVAALRETLLEVPGWSGEAERDDERAQLTAKGEFDIATLWVACVHALKYDRGGMAPWSREDLTARVLTSIVSWEPPDAAVTALRPPSSQYERLVESLARYRALATAGFTTVPKTIRRARPRAEHDAIVALRQRLSEEGAQLSNTDSPLWDRELTKVLRAEREFRQLKGYGKWKRNIDKKLIRILNIPAQQRVAELKLNLERWRTTDFHHYDYKVFINLPDFHGEVWDGPERVTRFKTVVGKNNVKDGRRVNATPVLTARIKRLVYNPTWTVPSRIIHEEILPDAEKKVEKDGLEQSPFDYLRSKGYRVWNEDNPKRLRLRRAPGPENALGKVKFQFDNRYFVFLHDTSSKGKFRHRRRALSHGCMRIHKPLDLAKILLTRDGTFWKVGRLRVMNHLKETPITLQKTVPLVIDYITARVTEDGRTRFLWDMYKHDKVSLASAKKSRPTAL